QGLGALVGVDAVGQQPVVAAAAVGVDQRPAAGVVALEPGAAELGPAAKARFTGEPVGRHAGGDERAGVNRLLVVDSAHAAAGIPAAVADQADAAVHL